MVAGYRIPTLCRHPYAYVFILLFFSPSLYLTAAYAIGKHVPGSNLFPTVRTRSTTTKVLG
ncbi:hypothetical protein V2W45_1319715 [Cenococcum geophilum]